MKDQQIHFMKKTSKDEKEELHRKVIAFAVCVENR